MSAANRRLDKSPAAKEFALFYATLSKESKLSKVPLDLLKAIWYDGYITGASHIKDGSLII